MTKVLVINQQLKMMEVKCFLFENFMLREKTSNYESLRTSAQFILLDLKTNLIHEVPFEHKDRAVRQYEPMFGSWNFSGKEVNKIDSAEEMFDDYKCLKVTEHVKIDTPLGPSESKSINYYADLDGLLSKYSPAEYCFMGFREQSHDPYKCLIRRDLENSEGTLFNILEVKITFEEADHSLVDEILSLPVKTETQE